MLTTLIMTIWEGKKVNKKIKGLLLCLAIAVPSLIFGKLVPVIGGPVTAILLGMIVTMFIKDKTPFADGIKFTSKKILQWAVILLGFGLNLGVILQTGIQSLPIIITTITVALLVAYLFNKVFKTPGNVTTLIGVGSSICGGSAIAAAAPVVDADDEEIAQAISVVFFFNVIAALVFPWLGTLIGFSTGSGEAFGIFAGTAVNDTSSVTATAATWDSLYGLGSETLDTAVTVKLTRTLAIIPICLGLAFIRRKKEAANSESGEPVSIKKIFPFFIILFLAASLITTILTAAGVNPAVFSPIKEVSKFFIILAMAAIGLNTNIVKLIKTGGKPLLLGFTCWVCITVMSIIMQHVMGIW